MLDRTQRAVDAYPVATIMTITNYQAKVWWNVYRTGDEQARDAATSMLMDESAQGKFSSWAEVAAFLHLIADALQKEGD